MVVVVLAVTGGAVHIGSAVVARHRAQAAADLGALAAAARLPAGPEAACAVAAQLIRRMRADPTDCVVQGLDVVVTAQAAPSLAALGAARAAARAGPA